MKRIVIFTGAGLDKESGIETFRGAKDSLWNNHKVSEVGTSEAYKKDPGMVLEFYNERRRQLATVEPNQAHFDLVALEDYYDVMHITQNVSDLLERSGSTNILHLHGELTKARSCMYAHKSSEIDEVLDNGYEDINLGDLNEHGVQIRPHIVLFGEGVPMITEAERIAGTADIMIVIGTTLEVYPAANLINRVSKNTPIYIIDPNKPSGLALNERYTFVQEPATKGVAKVVGELIKEAIESDD